MENFILANCKRILSENQSFRKYSGKNADCIAINDAVQSAFNNEVFYLKPVEHCGEKIPVTLIFRDFSNDFWTIKTIDPEKMSIETGINNISFDYLIRYGFLQEAIFELTIRCGGGVTIPMLIESSTGIFQNKSQYSYEYDGHTYECGIIILVDKNLMNKSINVDALIHHEYFHALYEKGLMEENFKAISKANSFEEAACFALQNTQMRTSNLEEQAADEFALIVTSKKINTLKIFTEYLTSNLGLSKRKARNLGIITLITQGRKF